MHEQMQNLISNMLKPLRNRVYNLISRAVLEKANDSGNMQIIKVGVLAGENRDDVENFQDYGFTSVAKAGAEVLIVCPQGNREHMIAVKVGDRTVRLKGLATGEVAIYDDLGSKIHLKRGGIIDVVSSSKVNVTSPEVEMSGNLTVKGNLTVDGTSQLEGAVTTGASITAGGAVTAPSVVGGSVVTTGGVDLDGVKTSYNVHKHNENGDGGGITDPPDTLI